MADLADITMDQLFRTPSILSNVVNRIAVRDSFFQSLFGIAVGSPATQRVRGNHCGWDIFDQTRTLATGRAPHAGPRSTSRKPVSHVNAQTFRLHEKMPLLDNEIYGRRAQGSPIGSLDPQAKKYIADQTNYVAQRFKNAREFMCSRIPRGGWGVRVSGEDWILTEKGTSGNTFDVDLQIPAANSGQLALGTSGANLIDEPWSDPSSDVPAQLLRVNRAYERLTGRRLKNIIINSTTFAYLQNNLILQTVAGSSNQVFEYITPRNTPDPSGIPDTGFQVKFRAMPLWTFHVFDGVLNVDGPDSTVEADCDMFVPDNKAILLPQISSDIIGWIEGSEYVAKAWNAPSEEVFGFDTWILRAMTPPAHEVYFIDNGTPAVYQPNAIMYPTVIF